MVSPRSSVSAVSPVSSVSSLSSYERNVDHSAPSWNNYPAPPSPKTIYSGISVAFTTRTTQPSSTREWKPVSIKAPVLLSFILASLALAAVIEYLAQRSQKEGGLSLTSDADDASSGVILSRYIPTVIAVLYSLTWTWIDLDIRRIQPWFELSRGEGGIAESSLLLDYPFEFLAFVPIKAWRKKHWLVFLAGTIMMLIFWALTPLQSAIFGTQSVVVSKQLTATDTSRLGTLEQQLDMMDSSILNTAYGITWLKQAFPAFTTSAHAFIPFQPDNKDDSRFPDEKWTASATALSTDLKCWPAIIQNLTDTERQYNFGDYTFDNSQGCQTTLTPASHGITANETGVIHTVLYIPYHENAAIDWFLQGDNCSDAAMHQFLAIWQVQDTKDMTALFCEPSYHKQEVMVTVSAQDKRPDETSLVPLGGLESLGESEFNVTAFEYLIGTGVTPKRMRRDYPRDRVLEQYPTLMEIKIAWPITNMVGFALGGMNYSLPELRDSKALEDIFASAHKKLFSAAIPSLVQPDDLSSTARPVTITYTLYGVVVSRPIALAVEILLLVISALVATLLFFSTRTQSLLTTDPGRGGATFAILGQSSALLGDFAYKDRYDEKTLQKSIGGNHYKLVRTQNLDGDRLHIEYTRPTAYTDPQLDPSSAECRPTQHSALKSLSGLTFVVIMLAGMAVLLYLKRQEEALGGLPRPSQSFEVLQLLENYIPTVFATLLEPFLVLLNRLLCLLQPFHDLRRGRQSASKAFETPYTSLPPQLALWDSLKSGHLLLGSLCFVTLLANVLAVALGAVFNENPVLVNYPKSLQQVYSTSINDTAFGHLSAVTSYDHFYVAATNLSSETSLPPWTDTAFAYMPFSTFPNDSNDTTSTYRAETKGFGVDVICSPLSTSPKSIPYVNYTFGDDGSQDMFVVVPAANGTVAKCRTVRGLERTPYLNISNPQPPGYLAQEMVTDLHTAFEYINGTQFEDEDTEACMGKLVMSWMRIEPRDRNGSFTATHLYCVPTWRSATFDVTVDSEGYVLGARRVGAFDDLDSNTRNRTEGVARDINGMIGSPAATPTNFDQPFGGQEGWHNDTLTGDWINYLLSLALNSRKLIDPTQPVPGPDSALTTPVEDMYKMLAANIIGSHLSSLLNLALQPIQLTGTEIVSETRIFMDETAFIAAIAILGLMVIVATSLYVRERKPFLPRLPSTIGSLLAYVAASRAVRGYGAPTRGYRASGRRKAGGETYSFGKYTGVDGAEHVGIELDPFVKPLDDGNPGRQKSSIRFRR